MRQLFLSLTLPLLVAGALGLPSPGPPTPSPQQRPNVVVLLTDDQTIDTLHFMPNVKHLLADQGTTFDRSFVSFSLCCPSRATFFTGQYAHNHGVRANHPPLGGYQKLDKHEWLPVWLQRAGYRTIQLGKFLNGYGRDNPTEVPPGWNEWHTSVDPSTYNYYTYTFNENGKLHSYDAYRDPDLYRTDFEARRARQIINRVAPSPQPFFLMWQFLAPHTGGPQEPGDPFDLATPAPAPRHRDRFSYLALPKPPSYNERDMSDKPRFIRSRRRISPAKGRSIRELYQQRLESLLAVDEAVASIVDSLQRGGELDNTLIVFTSDNGYLLGEHRVPAGKVLPYEPSIRVPLILRGPGVPRGQHRRQLVVNADLAPTILEAAGAQPGRMQDGRSLFPLLRDPRLEWGRSLLIEGGFGGFHRFEGLRTYRYLYVRYREGEQELYDLRHDPHELRSRHRSRRYARVRKLLARRLRRLRRCRGESCLAPPRARLRVLRAGRRCLARVSGPNVSAVLFASGRGVSRDRRRPFSRIVSGTQVRARISFRTADVLTLDRRLSGCG